MMIALSSFVTPTVKIYDFLYSSLNENVCIWLCEQDREDTRYCFVDGSWIDRTTRKVSSSQIVSFQTCKCLWIIYQILYLCKHSQRHSVDPFKVIGSRWSNLFTDRTIFCTNSHLFPSQWRSYTETFYKQVHCRINKTFVQTKKSYIWATEFCVFKMDIMKWELNFVLSNFGQKSYLWFQIKLALLTFLILKLRLWFQTRFTPLSSITII